MKPIQKIDFALLLTGYFVFPFIVGVMISSTIVMSPWFGPNRTEIPIDFAGLTNSLHKSFDATFTRETLYLTILSSGFFFTCFVGLLTEKRYREIIFIPIIFLVGFIVQFACTISVFKACLGIPVGFYRTPKKKMN
jgi:hypothetical protein